MTHEQIDKLNEHESTMDPEVAVKVARDMYLVHVPRYLAQFLKRGKRVLIEGETGWEVHLDMVRHKAPEVQVRNRNIYHRMALCKISGRS